MGEDLDYELRASWRQFETPDSDVARLTFENSQLRTALNTQATVEQAKGALMVTHGADAETVERLLREVARAERLQVADLARAVVDLASGATGTAGPRAREVAASGVLGVAQPTGAKSIHVRDKPATPSVDLRGRSSSKRRTIGGH